jgi:hypothetical protein
MPPGIADGKWAGGVSITSLACAQYAHVDLDQRIKLDLDPGGRNLRHPSSMIASLPMAPRPAPSTPTPPPISPLMTDIPVDRLTLSNPNIRAAAQKRETTTARIAAAIIEATVLGDIIDAVLDDRD